MDALDHRPMHRTALNVASAYVRRVDSSYLQLPTPCADWDLRQLLEHMVGQHLGFAAAVRDGDAPAEAYQPVPYSPDAWTSSVDSLTDAFAAADLTTTVIEVELHPTRPLPTSVLVDAQFLDTVIHTWDVAAALGERYVPPDDVAETMLRMAAAIPDDDRRDRPGAAFAHGVDTEGGAWEQALALLGRDPGWSSNARTT